MAAACTQLLFLLAHPSVSYYGFDLDDPFNWRATGFRVQWASKFAEAELQRRLPGRVNVTYGDSHQTIVPFFEARPGLKCDIISVDGDHSFNGVTTDLAQLEPHLRLGGLIFADDCNGSDRNKGSRSALAMFEAFATYVTARGQQVRSVASALAGILRVEYCPKNTNGFCVAAKGHLHAKVEKWLRSV